MRRKYVASKIENLQWNRVEWAQVELFGMYLHKNEYAIIFGKVSTQVKN